MSLFFLQKFQGRCARCVVGIVVFALSLAVHAADKTPLLIGIDGEFGLENSISAQAVELGIRTAVSEINAAGGVLVS